jgi:hypothetical protein
MRHAIPRPEVYYGWLIVATIFLDGHALKRRMQRFGGFCHPHARGVGLEPRAPSVSRNVAIAWLTAAGCSAMGKWPASRNVRYCEPGTVS